MYFQAMYRIDYVDILGRSFAMGRQTKVEWEKQAIFEQNASISQKQFKVSIND